MLANFRKKCVYNVHFRYLELDRADRPGCHGEDFAQKGRNMLCPLSSVCQLAISSPLFLLNRSGQGQSHILSHNDLIRDKFRVAE